MYEKIIFICSREQKLAIADQRVSRWIEVFRTQLPVPEKRSVCDRASNDKEAYASNAARDQKRAAKTLA
jgi:hypothetical protein